MKTEKELNMECQQEIVKLRVDFLKQGCERYEFTMFWGQGNFLDCDIAKIQNAEKVKYAFIKGNYKSDMFTYSAALLFMLGINAAVQTNTK